MANKFTTERKNAKAAAIIARLAELRDSREILISMLDEGKLDLLILALGIGSVSLASASISGMGEV